MRIKRMSKLNLATTIGQLLGNLDTASSDRDTPRFRAEDAPVVDGADESTA